MNEGKGIAISVIIPVYKAEKTLERALLSLEKQDLPYPFEVLFAFDEGGDRSGEICLEAIKRNPTYRLIEGKDRLGVGRGRLEAIKEAKGEYIAFLDSDDLYPSNALSTLYREAKQGNYDLVNASFYVLEEGKKPKKNLFSAKKEFREKKELLASFFADFSFRGFLWTKLIKRSLFFGHPLLLLSRSGDMFEDTALLGSLLPYVKKAKTIKTPVYYYDKGIPESATSLPRKDRFYRHEAVYALLRALYEREKEEEALLAFSKASFRIGLSFSYDRQLDKKHGADPKETKRLLKEGKGLFDLRKEPETLKKAREDLPARLIEL